MATRKKTARKRPAARVARRAAPARRPAKKARAAPRKSAAKAPKARKARPVAAKPAKVARKRAAKPVKKPVGAARRTPVKKPPAAPSARKPAATPSPADIKAMRWTETLADGTHVIIRPMRKQDVGLERSFIERLSPESRRMRFLGMVKEPSAEMLRCLTDLDFARDVAFVALVHRDNETREIGVSRYSTSDDGSSCECAVTVSDEWQHRGLATLLMRHLIEVARARGIRIMVSFDAAENVDMQKLAEHLGFERVSDPDDHHMVTHRLVL